MRLDEMFVAPGQMTVEECIAESEQPQFETATTPSGLEVYYQWAPKRLYKLRGADHQGQDGVEVPSVTTVLNVLDKSGALTWWGMKVGVEGCVALSDQGILTLEGPVENPRLVEQIIEKLTEHKLTVNHVKDKAADRGVNVHDALEFWCRTGTEPQWDDFPETEAGYVKGLASFIEAIKHVAEVDGMEVMVGSLEHLYAGRFDLVLNISSPIEVVTRCYPKRADKLETIPAGRYLVDLKSSKNIYDSHRIQLEAYEHAAVECGYAPTDYRAVLHVTADGKYEFSVSNGWCFDDFLAVRRAYGVVKERDKLASEREIEAALRSELGAKDAA